MRAAEFMKTLVDVIKFIDSDSTPDTENLTPMEKDDRFVPPLQQKIELMKKMADHPSSAEKASIADDTDPLEG